MKGSLKVYLCCSGGMSTSLLAKRARQAAAERSVSIDIDIQAVDSDLLERKLEGADLVLLGPHLRYKADSIQRRAPKSVRVAIIDTAIYQTFDGRRLLDQILSYNMEAAPGRRKSFSDEESGTMKIMLCCAAGMSTSLLVAKMQEAAKKEGLEAEITALPADEAKQKLHEVDVVLLGPQVRYLYIEMKTLAEEHGIKADVIQPMHYGLCDGAAVLKQAVDLIKSG